MEPHRMGVIYYDHGLLAWILIGLIAGWLTGTVTRGRGFGCFADTILGMVGALIGGWIFWEPRGRVRWRRGACSDRAPLRGQQKLRSKTRIRTPQPDCGQVLNKPSVR